MHLSQAEESQGRQGASSSVLKKQWADKGAKGKETSHVKAQKSEWARCSGPLNRKEAQELGRGRWWGTLFARLSAHRPVFPFLTRDRLGHLCLCPYLGLSHSSILGSNTGFLGNSYFFAHYIHHMTYHNNSLFNCLTSQPDRDLFKIESQCLACSLAWSRRTHGLN